jgi:serine/threonine protein kinase
MIAPIMRLSTNVPGEDVTVEIALSHNLKGYELRERIGAGGFGAVYRAYQSTVGREVAVKIILPGMANQDEIVIVFNLGLILIYFIG